MPALMAINVLMTRVKGGSESDMVLGILIFPVQELRSDSCGPLHRWIALQKSRCPWSPERPLLIPWLAVRSLPENPRRTCCAKALHSQLLRLRASIRSWSHFPTVSLTSGLLPAAPATKPTRPELPHSAALRLPHS